MLSCKLQQVYSTNSQFGVMTSALSLDASSNVLDGTVGFVRNGRGKFTGRSGRSIFIFTIRPRNCLFSVSTCLLETSMINVKGYSLRTTL
jgi:hypothetical protein